MKKTKYAVTVIFIIVLMSVLIIPASALSAEFSITSDYDNLMTGDTFEVIVAVNNIQDDFGIVLVECRLYFDTEYFEIVSWEHNKPESWGAEFEDLSTKWAREGEEQFKCAFLYGGTKKVGIIDDGVLFSKIVFKVIADGFDSKVIYLREATITNDNMEDADCNDAILKITKQGAVELSDESEVSKASDASSDDDTSSVVASESPAADGDSSDDTEVKGTSNALKIVFAASVVIIIAALGVVFNMRKKNSN
ncbi:MAG: hypothetical protein CVU97_03730 [Firmicutes bacterium HGW-Firmicutes-21]|nr:MAG: hypothetical protein CVU97_03730 [Firmicutes bacterium HGW-Firmicutes-21]